MDVPNEPKTISLFLDGLPYPALAVRRGDILYRNRLAKRLLPPPYRLKRFLQTGRFPEERGFLESELEGRRYFVGVFPQGSGERVVCFLECFLPLYEPLSRLYLEEMRSLTWEMPLLAEKTKGADLEKYLNGVAARTKRLRQGEGAYLRLLRMKDRARQKAAPCSVPGFFGTLGEALSERGICLSALCPPHAAVEICPGSLSFLVLNLIQFAYLFQGTQKISVKAEKAGKRYRLSFSFSDQKDLYSVLEDLVLGKSGLDAGHLFAAPFLCVLRLCRQDGIPWRLGREKEDLLFSVFLPASDDLPDSFFSQTAAEEARELLGLEKEYFS